MTVGYPEGALVANRTSVLLFGGSEEDRRAWADEAASSLVGEGPLRVVTSDAEVNRAIQPASGVVFFPNAAQLSSETQMLLVRCLREREERPKLVVALPHSPTAATERGTLRLDLDYALQLGRVDLGASEVKVSIRERRAKQRALDAKAKAKARSKVQAKKKRR